MGRVQIGTHPLDAHAVAASWEGRVMAEHTQLPWKRIGLMLVAPDGSKVVHFGGFRKEGREAEANAALTDAAVNNHGALVTEGESCAGALVEAANVLRAEFPGLADIMDGHAKRFLAVLKAAQT